MQKITKIIILIGFGLFIGLDVPYFIEILFQIKLIADIMDIIFVFPLYLLGTYALYRIFNPESTSLQYFYIFSIGLFLEGHGFHWAANAIHNMMTPGEAGFNMAYFLDEVAGHIILFSGSFLTLVSLCLMQHRRKIKIEKDDKLWLILSSLPFGFFLAIGFIEGQVIYIFLPTTVLLFIFLLYYYIKSKIDFEEEPLNFFIFLTSIVIIILSFIYYLIFGSFVQPSQIFHF